MTIADGILYDALKSGIDNSVDVSELTWRDPIASTVLSDDSVVVNKLGRKQKRIFSVIIIHSINILMKFDYIEKYLVKFIYKQLYIYYLGASREHEMQTPGLSFF